MMRMTLLAVAAVSVLAFGAQTTFAEETCTGSGTQLTKSEVEARLIAQGYTQVREIKSHGGCYEAKGLDQKGQRFELEVNSFTGKISNKEE
jgi:hypothetical protein